jgi:transposase
MYIRSQTVRKPNGKEYTYYRLVESYREHGQVRQRVLGELGALSREEAARLSKRLAQIAGLPRIEDEDEEVEFNGMRYFGAPLLVWRLLEILRLPRCLEIALKGRRLNFDALSAVKIMLCAHLFKSGSKAEWAVWEWQQKLFGHGDLLPDIEYAQLLRSVATLPEIKEEVESYLFGQLVDLFDLQVDMVFYDLTSTYVEGLAEWSELLEFGYSRDKRSDCRQVVIGLVVTREGFPITVRVFKGNTLDKKTLMEMKAELEKRFSIRRCVWVSDCGLLTKENRDLLEGSGEQYIFGAGGGSGKELQEALKKTEKGKRAEVEGVGVWEIPLQDRRRAIVVESEGRRAKNEAILERRLKRVRAGLQKLLKQVEEGRVKKGEEIRLKAEKILHKSRVKKYFSYEVGDGRLKWTEDETAVSDRKKNGGKYALLTNTTLALEEVLESYRILLLVEEAFRILKDELDCRPLWHKNDDSVEGHVLMTVWSLVLYKTLEEHLKRAGVDLETSRALNAVKEVRAVEVSRKPEPVWRMIKPSTDAARVFKAVGIEDVKSLFNQWKKTASPYTYQRRCVKEEVVDRASN